MLRHLNYIIDFECDQWAAFSYMKYTIKKANVMALIMQIKAAHSDYLAKKRKNSGF